MGIMDEVLALAGQVEATIGGCGECIARREDGRCLSADTFECSDAICREVTKRLREIVERDAEDVTTVSAYDLLSDDEREAIAWSSVVGGIDRAKDLYYLGLELLDALGFYEGGEPTNADCTKARQELDKRLMPEGVEWPRYETGEPVRWNDEYANGKGGVSPLRHVHLYADGRTMLGKGNAKVVLSPGERVKRPAPKVLDADGVEIRVGDTVYVVGWDKSLTVKGFDDYGLVLVDYHNENSLGYKPSSLTHERPDSWERWREDAELSPVDYCDRHRVGRIGYEELGMHKDLVRRARALAERGA